MRVRPGLFVILLGAVLAAVPARAPGQDAETEKRRSESHLLDPFPPPRGAGQLENLVQRRQQKNYQNLAELLKQRGITAEQLAEVQNQLKQNPGLAKQALSQEALGQLPPQFQNLLRNLKQEQWDNALNPEKLGEIQKHMQQSGQPGQGQPGAEQGTRPGEITPNPQGAPPEQEAPGNGPRTPPRMQEPSQAPESSSQAQNQNSTMTQRVLRWLDPALRSSPALRRAVRELGKETDEDDPRWHRLSEGAERIRDQAAHYANEWGLERLLPNGKLGWPQSLTPSTLPGARLLGGGSSGGGSAGGGAPTGGMPGGGSEGFQVLLTAGGVFALAFLLWRMFGKGSVKRQAAAWVPGPWPVAPDAVASREDLIRAFEYLSLRTLGQQARTWNHVAIGGRLGDPEAPEGRQRAAQELVSLYEQARYAPLSDELPEGAFEAARRDLTLLAGALPA
jgi:hypothetical protein